MDRPGYKKDFKSIAATTSRNLTEAVLHPSAPRSNQDLMHTAGNERVRTALKHFGFSTTTVPLTDGNKMHLHHHGCSMKRIFGPLTVFHTHNYADNYSLEILKLLCLEQSATDYVENQAWLDNFRVRSVNGLKDREDDVASDGLRGLADFTSTLFKCTEDQARGSAQGHSKVHSIPDGVTGLLQCLERLTEEINKLQEFSSGLHPTDELVESMVTKYTETYRRGHTTSHYHNRKEVVRGDVYRSSYTAMVYPGQKCLHLSVYYTRVNPAANPKASVYNGRLIYTKTLYTTPESWSHPAANFIVQTVLVTPGC